VVNSASNRNWVPGIFLGANGAYGWQPHSRLWEDCLENVGASTSHNPMGLHGQLQGVLPFLCLMAISYRKDDASRRKFHITTERNGSRDSSDGDEAAGAWSWSLTSNQCRGQEHVSRLYGVVLNYLRRGTNLPYEWEIIWAKCWVNFFVWRQTCMDHRNMNTL
jgi:hypothetical protein